MNDPTKFVVRLPADLHALVSEAAARTGTSMNSVILAAIRVELSKPAVPADEVTLRQAWQADFTKLEERVTALLSNPVYSVTIPTGELDSSSAKRHFMGTGRLSESQPELGYLSLREGLLFTSRFSAAQLQRPVKDPSPAGSEPISGIQTLQHLTQPGALEWDGPIIEEQPTGEDGELCLCGGGWHKNDGTGPENYDSAVMLDVRHRHGGIVRGQTNLQDCWEITECFRPMEITHWRFS